MVSAGDVPKSFWDLVEPKWKGQLLMDENESKWMAGMISYFGEAKAMDLMRKLAGQHIQFRVGHSLLQTLLAAGERAAVVVAFANGVDRLKKDGAPIEWVGADPIIGLTFGSAVVKDAPHPNAARLLSDFLLSREGQEVITSAGYYSPRGCQFADSQGSADKGEDRSATDDLSVTLQRIFSKLPKGDGAPMTWTIQCLVRAFPCGRRQG